MLPPLLTVAIFLWVAGTIQQYALQPVMIGARNVLALYWARQDDQKLAAANVQAKIAQQAEAISLPSGESYERTPRGLYLPSRVVEAVAEENPNGVIRDASRQAIYQRYAELEYLQPQRVIPLFLGVFVLLLYLLGRFLAAGIGRVFWNLFEGGIHRLPVVRNVYDSVKQVTDFMFDDREIEYTRVVAVEYPRRDLVRWVCDGRKLAGYPCGHGRADAVVDDSHSPMSVTGYTITVPKSETIDLNMTMDQALQFVISCGVVIPAQGTVHNVEAAS